MAMNNQLVRACWLFCVFCVTVGWMIRMPTSLDISEDERNLSTSQSILMFPDAPTILKSSTPIVVVSRKEVPVRNQPTNTSSHFLYVLSKLPKTYHSHVKSSIQAAIQPLWTCHGKSSTVVEKLLFVHVFKTAGSTMRSFFHNYANHCRRQSYATLTKCTNVDSKRLASSSWSPCLLKDARKKGKYRHLNRKPVRRTDLDYTILGGHFRLGLVDRLSNKPQQKQQRQQQFPNPKFRNLIFFRNAAVKYVSGKVYIKSQNPKKKKTITSSEIIRGIQSEMKHAERLQKYHSKYATYLLTPEQHHQSHNWTYAQQVHIMCQNLIDYNVTIGIVEEMSQSMEVLQHLMDPQHDVTPLFVRYSQSNSSSRNISPISSHGILDQLQREDRDTYQRLLNYVKWEQEVTDFALALQQLQYEAMHM